MTIQTRTRNLMPDVVRKLALVLVFAAISRVSAWGASETVLWRFQPVVGANPYGTMVFDAAGNLYGTTSVGGPEGGSGVVFKLSPLAGGGWLEHFLHIFNNAQNSTEGTGPFGGVIFDAAGNLYGVTQFGGGSSNCSGGCGTVFQLRPTAVGQWNEYICTNSRVEAMGLILTMPW